MVHDPQPTQTLDNLPEPLAAGARLAGRFVVERLLGRGAHGFVYRARDERLGVAVALKLLDGGDAKALGNELLLARRISHDNVVRLHDLVETEQGLCCTMELIEGESLAERLDREGRLPPAVVATLARQLLDALALAHRKQVVHLDLKPDNILLDGQGQPHISDFGIARALDADGATRGRAGTPDYLSPEQLQGRPLDGRSDLFSLGVILYEAATGCLPFEGEDPEARMQARLARRPQPPHLRCHDIPLGLSRLIMALLAIHPRQRPADASQALARLAPRPARRRPWYWGAALVLLAVLAWWRWPPGSPRDEGGATAVPPLLILPAEVAAPLPAWLSEAAAEQLYSQLGGSARLQLVEQKQVFNYIRQMDWQPPLSPAQQRELLQAFEAAWVVAPGIRPLQEDWHLALRFGPPGQLSGELLESHSAPGAVLTALGELGGQLLIRLDRGAQAPPAVPAAQLAEVNLVRQHLDRGEHDQALASLNRLTRQWPSALSWYLTFRAYDGLGRAEGATQALAKAAERLGDPDSTLALRIQFEQQRLAGTAEQALATLALLRARQPFDGRLAHLNAELLAEHRDLNAAIAALQDWLAVSPADARGWYLLGRQQIRQGQPRPALENALARALVLARSQRQGALEADVLAALGVAQEHLGELALARDYYRQALAGRQALGDEPGQAGLLANLAFLSAIAGQLEQAGKLLDRAEQLLQGDHAPALLASILNDKGLLLEELGRYGEAKGQYLKALRLRRELGDPGLVAESQVNVGYMAMLSGNGEEARVYFQQAQAGYQAMGDSRGDMRCRQHLATLDGQDGRWPQATRAWLQSRQEAEALGDQQARLSAMIHLAQLGLWRGQSVQAEAELAAAARLADELEDPRARREILLLRAELALRYGGDPLAHGLDPDATPDQQARQRLIRAEWLLEQGLRSQARTELEGLMARPLPAWEAGWRQVLAARLGLAPSQAVSPARIWRWYQGLEAPPAQSWFQLRQQALRCEQATCQALPAWFRRGLDQQQRQAFLALPWIPERWREDDGAA
ncbi:protein kinase [Gallaecimonas sp. GXIMD4217]|uniref:protein kinase domain-containing protein n=1 Tax=Gallaecimonas sp. GXIMD4217 TaxID=3131927 RepID=UPI00311AC181